MSSGTDPDSSPLTAEDAFDTIGDAIRIEILQRLGEEGAQPFTALRKLVGVDDSGRFNYHLSELTGHFVRKTDDGYALREPGSRIVQAILSGIVTDDAVMDTADLDAPCPYCGNPIHLMYQEERVVISCDQCPGSFAGTETDARFLEAHPRGTVAVLKFPPAGLAGRSDQELLEAALGWTLQQTQTLANGICPRCAGVVERSLTVCRDHTSSQDICEECGGRYGMLVDYVCTTCIHTELNFPVGLHLLVTAPPLLDFVATRGTNPIHPTWEDHAEVSAFAEEITQHDPVKARFTYVFKGDTLKLLVNEELSVIEFSEPSLG